MEQTNKVYPCHINPTISPEQFIPEHIFIYLESGSMSVFDGEGEYKISSGDYCLARRNRLARYLKKSLPGDEFRTTALFFDPEFLRSFAKEFNYHSEGIAVKDAIIKLKPNLLFETYVKSLKDYKAVLKEEDEHFLALKNKEIIFILLKTNPHLKDILFDFKDPDKIDLKAFMEQNYKFNVGMERFAYLTGRSLTSFKRDFFKAFNLAPGKWLLEKRLQEAYFQIEKLGRKPSQIYLELGFEDLSHFSFSFKKRFGRTPKQLLISPA